MKMQQVLCQWQMPCQTCGIVLDKLERGIYCKDCRLEAIEDKRIEFLENRVEHLEKEIKKLEERVKAALDNF